MIYAGIDVNIITHEKALVAGVEAMGLWLWGMCYAQIHETDGRLPRVAVLAALGGRRNIMHAKRLVEAGLWVEGEDGSWSIFNYGKKNQTAAEIQKKREAAAERSKRWRGKLRDASVTRDATGTVTRDGPCDARVSADPPPSPSPSLQTQTPPSPEREGDPARVTGLQRVLRDDEPLTDKRRGYVETVRMTSGVAIDADALWKRFVNDRIAKTMFFGSERAVDADWRKWVDAEPGFARKRRGQADNRQPLLDPANAPWLKASGGDL
jgi:hypothetical protein